MKKLLMLPLVAGLAGCGGASTSGSNAFGVLINDYTGLLDVVGTPDAPLLATTPDEDLPSGEVSYDGVISISERETPSDPVVFSALGSFSATVDFANPDGATGTGRNFFEIDAAGSPTSATEGSPISGSLTYSGATDRVTGTLTKLSGEVATYDMDISTNPAGPAAEYFAGFGFGTSTADGRDDNQATHVFLGER